MEDKILVSIVVITYNSSQYVLDTLESAKAQSYQNIELIVTDDCSTDDTVEICRDWLDKNETRFTRTKLITSPCNTGIPANCNRGYRMAQGEWIKGIAGDDILYPNAIEAYVNHAIRDDGSTGIIFAKVTPFTDVGLLKEYRHFKYQYFYLAPSEFKCLLLAGNFLPASTAFIRKSIIIRCSYFNENIPLMEDWPFFIKAIVIYNVNVGFINKELVYYRISDSSLSNGSKSQAYIDSENLAKNYSLRYQFKKNKLLWLYSKCSYNFTNNSFFCNIFKKLLIKINPITWYIEYLKRKADKKYYIKIYNQ